MHIKFKRKPLAAKCSNKPQVEVMAWFGVDGP